MPSLAFRIHRFAKIVFFFYLTFFFFLAPFKFGMAVHTGQIPVFPLNIWEWLFGNWPPFLFSVLAGIALIWSILLFPAQQCGRYELFFPFVWIAFFAAALIGLIRTTAFHYCMVFLPFMLGVFCISMAVLRALKNEPKLRYWLLTGVICGSLLAAFSGWHQVKGGGFEQTRKYLEGQNYARSSELSQEIHARLKRERAFGPFVYPNSYAAHLVLTLPLVLVGLHRFAGLFHPPRVSQALFVPAGFILMVGALYYSKSRAALVALIVAAIVTLLFEKGIPRKLKVTGGGAFIILLAAGFAYMNLNKADPLSSVEARFKYWRAGGHMFLEHPFTGVGTGEFFYHYIRLKPEGAEPTRIPHNFFLFFLAQTGIFGGIAALVFLGGPAGMILFKPENRDAQAEGWLTAAIKVGVLAWSIHALADFNLQIPATVATFGILPLCILYRSNPESTPSLKRSSKYMQGALLCIVAMVCIGNLWRMPGTKNHRILRNALMRENIGLEVLKKQTRRTSRQLPWSPFPWLALVKEARYRGDLEMAKNACRKALKRAPHWSAPWKDLGEIYYQVGKKEKALEALQRAQQWHPASEELRKLHSQWAQEKNSP